MTTVDILRHDLFLLSSHRTLAHGTPAWETWYTQCLEKQQQLDAAIDREKKIANCGRVADWGEVQL